MKFDLNTITKRTITELLHIQTEVAKAIEIVRQTEKDKISQEIANLITSRGFNLEDFFGAKNAAKRGTAKKQSAERKWRIYANPANRELVWIKKGRAAKPEWINELEKQGIDIETLRVDNV